MQVQKFEKNKNIQLFAVWFDVKSPEEQKPLQFNIEIHKYRDLMSPDDTKS
jgi:hypothetical protein